MPIDVGQPWGRYLTNKSEQIQYIREPWIKIGKRIITLDIFEMEYFWIGPNLIFPKTKHRS